MEQVLRSETLNTSHLGVGFVSSHRLVRNDHLVLIVVISMLVISSPSISNYGYFDISKVVYGQSDPDQMNSNTTNSVNIQDIPLEKSVLEILMLRTRCLVKVIL